MISKTSRWARFGGVAAITAAMAGCGGGGGHHHPPPIVVPDGVRVEAASANSDVSGDNFDTLAGPLVRLVASTGGSPAEGSLKADRATALALRTPGGAPAVSRLLRRVATGLQQASESAAQGTPKAQAQAIRNETFACDGGGTLTMSTDDADNDDRPSPGDSVSASFSDCKLDALALPANGRFTFTIHDLDFDSRGNVVGLIVEGVFDGLEVGDAVSLDGAFTAWQTVSGSGIERYRFSYADVHAVSRGESTTYNVDIDGVFENNTDTFAIDGAIGLRRQTFKVVQGDVFRAVGSEYPSSGTIFLQDIEGDTLRMEARSNERIDFEFIPQGSTSPTFEWLDRTWSDFGT